MIAMLERNMVNSHKTFGAHLHDIAKPAHQRTLREAELWKMD